MHSKTYKYCKDTIKNFIFEFTACLIVIIGFSLMKTVNNIDSMGSVVLIISVLGIASAQLWLLLKQLTTLRVESSFKEAIQRSKKFVHSSLYWYVMPLFTGLLLKFSGELIDSKNSDHFITTLVTLVLIYSVALIATLYRRRKMLSDISNMLASS